MSSAKGKVEKSSVAPNGEREAVKAVAPRGERAETQTVASNGEPSKPSTSVDLSLREAKAAEKRKIRAEREQLITATLFPTADLLEEFGHRAGVEFNARKMNDSSKFQDQWYAYKQQAEPSQESLWKLRDLVISLHTKGAVKRFSSDSNKGKDKRSRSMLSSDSNSPSSVGKQPFKIPKVSTPAASSSAQAPTAEQPMDTGEVDEAAVGDTDAYDTLAIQAHGGTYAEATSKGKQKLDNPYLLYVHRSKEDRFYMKKEKWALLDEKFQDAVGNLVLQDRPWPRILWQGYSKGVGIISPADEESMVIAKEVVSTLSIAGEEFKAWTKTEPGKYMPVTIQIPARLKQSSFPSGKLVTMLCKQNQLPDGKDNIVIRNCEVVKGQQSRTLRLGVSEEVFNRMKNLGGILWTAGTRLDVHFNRAQLSDLLG